MGAMALLSARGRPFVVEGQPPSSRDAAPIAIYRVATPEFLATMGIPLMMGRDFSQNDPTVSPGVAIVNRTLARVSCGRQAIRSKGGSSRRCRQAIRWVTVIGVASDVRESLDPRYPLELEPRPTIYRPISQEPITGMTVIVRTAPDPMTLAEPVRREITGGGFDGSGHGDANCAARAERKHAHTSFQYYSAHRVCCARAATGGGGSLRRRRLLSEPTETGNRHPNGTGSRADTGYCAR